MVQLLIVVGASIFVLLGVIHTIFTLQDLGNPRNFAPRDAELLAAMQQSAVGLDPKINHWQAWLGFHFSHSLGLLMFGGSFLYVGIFHSSVFARFAAFASRFRFDTGNLCGFVAKILVRKSGCVRGNCVGVFYFGDCVVLCLSLCGLSGSALRRVCR